MNDDLDIDLKRYIVVFRRRFLLILGTALLAALAAWLLSSEIPKTYEASVLIATQQPDVARLAAPSETVFSRAANIDTLVDSLRVRQMAASKLRQAGLSEVSVLTLEDLNTRVRSSGQDLMKLSVQGNEPRLVAGAANALAAALVENDRNARRANAQATRRFVYNQLSLAQNRLSRAEDALGVFRRRTQGGTSANATIEEGRLQRELRLAEENFLFLSQKLQESRIAEASIASTLLILQQAEVPTLPVKPRIKLNTLLGLVLGLLGGGAAALVLESMDERLRDSTDVGRATQAMTLAELPRAPLRAGRNGSPEIGLVLVEDPQSLLAEGYRLLRSAVVFAAAKQNFRSVMVTSPGPGQGKTTIAANLAAALALSGKRTALIEADLRRPQIERLLPWSPDSPTLLSALQGNGSHLPLQTTPLAMLAWLPSGGAHPESTELLSTDRLQRVVSEIKQDADFVIVDAPPVLPVSDALIIGTFIDAALLVVESGVTTRNELRETLERLDHAGIKILGIVLNKTPLNNRRYYQTYYTPTRVPQKTVSN